MTLSTPAASIANVAVEGTAFHFDKLYGYRIPVELMGQVQPGCRVVVPFGMGNRKRQGLVMSLGETADVEKIKPLHSLLDEKPVLSQELLQLAAWLKQKTYCTTFESAKAMLPAGINVNLSVSYCAAPDVDPEKLETLSDDGKRLVEILRRSRAMVTRSRLLKVMGLDEKSRLPDELAEQGVIMRSDSAVRRVGDLTVRMARLCDPQSAEELLSGSDLTPKQKNVVRFLQEAGTASIKEIGYFAFCGPGVVTALERKGVVLCYQHQVYRNPFRDQVQGPASPIQLTQSQQDVFDRLLAQIRAGGGVSLLHGITGSGKTQVFLRLAQEVVESGRSVIVMVPEISLTPQTMQLFYTRFGSRVAVIHSGLSLGERLDEWKRIKNGEAPVIVGTRSAVFAPCENIGLIIMDEEQESSYKSEAAPRFHAKDVAKFRAKWHKAQLLLCSATPSLTSYYAAKQGRYSLHQLKERYGDAVLPKVEIVDMRGESPGSGSISQALREALEQNLEAGNQSILLLNRRGYNTFASCLSCGEVISCPYCSISMTYHAANGRLMCHYCGHSQEVPSVCPHCGEGHIQYTGFGTQRVEQELQELLPSARIVRMDTDTTMSHLSHESKLKAFAQGQYDIMIGTQMVAKGLDFEKVTLVGVILADQPLYNDDYRSYERTFALLTQVVGRAGRRGTKGRAIIQTYIPDHPILHLAAAQDYEAFYETEIATRKMMLYPPFCDICMVGFLGIKEQKVADSAHYFLQRFADAASRDYSDLPLQVLGPAPASIARVNGKYRYRLIVKCRDGRRFRQLMALLLTDFGKKREYSDVTAFADMNPEGIL
ncbi:primosomal protein N' [[Clostridium] leptum]|nr:primosomal protein N' [[Clostridium] leptum]